MFKLSVSIIFATICVVVSNAALSDEIKEIQFTKAQDGSEEFNFEYKLDNGELYQGKSIVLFKNSTPVQLIMGADSFYWTEMTDDENQNTAPFLKFVRLVEKTDTALAHFKDDRYEYFIDNEGNAQQISYATAWDLENVAFLTLDNERKTFKYVISSLNNSKKYYGTTNYEADQHIQEGSIPTFTEICLNKFEVFITDEELGHNGTFYKNVEQIDVYCPVGASPTSAIVQEISPNALKSLVG